MTGHSVALSHVTRRVLWLREIWIYTCSLTAVLSAICYILSGDWRLVAVVDAAAGTVGVIGTVLAVAKTWSNNGRAESWDSIFRSSQQ
jgi:hypothetical protein